MDNDNTPVSSQDGLRLNCLIEGKTTIFEVTAGHNDSISVLKNNIRRCGARGTLKDVDAMDLKLWKVDINLKGRIKDTLCDLRIEDKNTELSEWEPILEYWPEQPPNRHLHIMVKLPISVPPTASRKRSRSETEEDGRAAKRKEIASNETRCAAIYEAVKAMQDLNLSDPSTFTAIPFPSLLRMPDQRFERKVIDGTDYFEYMGRSQFHEFQKRVEDKAFLKGRESLYLYGTSGSGKSHILAALVYHLIREGKRVFYIPDCYGLLSEPKQVMWDAFHFAFYDSPVLETVTDPNNVKELIRLIDQDVYIIVDQVNALEGKDNKKRKNRALRWLNSLRYKHRYIFSASANEISNRDADTKQNGIWVFRTFGGMNQDETDKWFEWHRDRIPRLSDKQRQHVEYLTGRIPLLLRCLFTMSKFSEPDFRNIPVLCNIYYEVDKFARNKFAFLRPDPSSQKTYLEIMTACVRGGYVTYNDRNLYDLRYFYVDNSRIGRSTCGLAFEAMVSILRRLDNTPFVNSLWYTTVSQSKNPTVKGFLAEQICLSHIAANGLMAVDDNLGPMSTESFKAEPNFDHQLSSDHNVCLYIPDAYNFMAVDGVILLLDRVFKKATVFSIQFTLSSNHKQSDENFHVRLWSTWTRPIVKAGFDVRSTFVWIDKKQPSIEVKEAVSKHFLSGPKDVYPKYDVIHVGIKAVHPRLADALGIQQ